MPWLFSLVEYLHVFSAIVAVGFNATYAIWIVRGQRQPEHLEFALKTVKFLDDRVANPAYALLLITGLALAVLGHTPLTTHWLLLALVLYVIAVAMGLGLYTPTLSRQIRALAASGKDSAEFRALSSRGTVVGISVGIVVAIIVLLMVFQPAF
ncbi:MAG TPA: DUF2269 family protein [Ktedonobacterales bacterium]